MPTIMMVPYMDNMDNDMSSEVFTITLTMAGHFTHVTTLFIRILTTLVAGPTNENAKYKQGLTNDWERGTYIAETKST